LHHAPLSVGAGDNRILSRGRRDRSPANRRLAGALLAISACVSAVHASAQAPPEPPVLTLDEAIARALTSNRLVASAALDVSRAEERVAAAKSNRWPTLSLTVLASRLLTPIDFEFEKGVFGDFPGVGPIPAEDTEIGSPRGFTTLGLGQLQFPISQQYEIGLSVRLNSASLDTAREELRQQRHAVVNDVRRAYYGILSAESALAAADESLTLAREVERVVGERLRAQKALEVDQIEARARVSRSDAGAFSARNAVATQKEQLNLLLGRDLGSDFRVVSAVEQPAYPGDLAAARSRARELQPALKEAELKVVQAEFAWRLAKAEFLPDLGFQANYVSPYSSEFLPRNIFSIGFFLSWDVFDAGKRKHEAAEKAHALEQAKLAVAQTESAIAVDVGREFRRFEQSRRELTASELERSARRERLRISKDQFRAEVVTAEQLLRAQSDLADADRQYVQALSTFWSARADLERAVGEESW
jgi:outer membrane protein TolC